MTYRPEDVNLYTISDIINTLSELLGGVFGEYSMKVWSARGDEVYVYANVRTPWGGIAICVCVWTDEWMEMLRILPKPRRDVLAYFEAWINVSWWTSFKVSYRDLQWRPSLLDVLRRAFGLLTMAVGVYR